MKVAEAIFAYAGLIIAIWMTSLVIWLVNNGRFIYDGNDHSQGAASAKNWAIFFLIISILAFLGLTVYLIKGQKINVTETLQKRIIE